MTKVTYVVFVRGPVPRDLSERISQAHAKAMLAGELPAVKITEPTEEQTQPEMNGEVNYLKP